MNRFIETWLSFSSHCYSGISDLSSDYLDIPHVDIGVEHDSETIWTPKARSSYLPSEQPYLGGNIFLFYQDSEFSSEAGSDKC